MSKQPLRQKILNFELDDYLNRIIPRSIVPRLPYPIAYFLGYRKSQPSELPSLLLTLHSFVSIFTALLCVAAITQHAPAIHAHSPPILIASLGAGAIINYTTLSLPAAQPRPTILGQAFAAIIGVSISKLFQLNSNFANLQWIAGPLACALAAVVMRFTNSIHPPGGATAILAVASADVRKLGWWLVPVILIGTTTMVGVACIVNNLGRRYPLFWWTGAELPVRSEREKTEGGAEKEEYKTGVARDSESGSDSSGDLEKAESNDSQTGLRDGVCPCCGHRPSSS